VPRRLRTLPPCPPFFEDSLQTVTELGLTQADPRLGPPLAHACCAAPHMALWGQGSLADHMRGRAGKYLQTLATALDTGSSWLAILEGRKGVKLFSAVGPLCGVGEIHGWQNSLSLWTCSPAMHRMLVINNTTIDARHGGPGFGLGAGAHHTVQH